MPGKTAKGSNSQMFDRDEERRWRAERRAGEEQRLSEERRWLAKPAIVGLRATDLRKAEWLSAMRWRRRIESACAASRLSFPQWLLLHSAQRLIEETQDAVIQAQIAARIELDQATVSQLVRRLEERQLVSRGGDITGKAWRVYLTDEARQLLRELDDPIEATSAAVR
jgi:DNA-binding MarR family transcriptional regulator